MSLSLKKELRAQLYTHVCAFLRNAYVKNDRFLDWETVGEVLGEADECLPSSGPLREQLFEYIHEFPVQEFVTDFVSSELEDFGDYDGSIERRRLCELNHFSDVHATAEKILSEFESLPWQYTLTLQLPECISDSLDLPDSRLELTPDISFEIGSRLESEFPLEHATEFERHRLEFEFSENLPDKWDNNSIYMQVKAQGYIGPFPGKTPHLSAVDHMKSAIGLLIASNALGVQTIWEAPTPVQYIYVHRHTADQNILASALEISRSMQLVLERLRAGTLKDSAATDADRKSTFLSTTRALSPIFKNRQGAENLRAAARWLFDSNGTQDPLLQYVQSMVVLEILLGSQKHATDLSIGETIANRCAYLVGEDWKERQSILEDFKEIYGVRSQIVHRGKSRLSRAERVLLGKLQELGKRVILEETQRMPA